MISVDDLMAWLRDVLDQRERVAWAAADYGAEWRYSDSGIYPSDKSRHPGALVVGGYGYLDEQYGEHIAMNDPVQILADIAADRRILDLYQHRVESMRRYPNNGNANATAALQEGVALVALRYAGWPGYRPEWAPDPN